MKGFKFIILVIKRLFKVISIRKDFETEVKEYVSNLNEEYNLHNHNIRILVKWRTVFIRGCRRHGRKRTRVPKIHFDIW